MSPWWPPPVRSCSDTAMITGATPPVPLWTPSAARRHRSRLGRWLTELAAAGVLPTVFDEGLGPPGVPPENSQRSAYDSAWRWSVERPEEFWPAAGAHLGIEWSTPPTATVETSDGEVEGAR